MGNDKQAHK